MACLLNVFFGFQLASKFSAEVGWVLLGLLLHAAAQAIPGAVAGESSEYPLVHHALNVVFEPYAIESCDCVCVHVCMYIIHVFAYIHFCLLIKANILETCSVQSLRLLLEISLIMYDGISQLKHLDPMALALSGVDC